MEKMRFAFKSDLHYEELRFNDSFRFVIFCEGKAQGATWYEDQAELICQAVNNHDRLAEENAQLKADKSELVAKIELNNKLLAAVLDNRNGLNGSDFCAIECLVKNNSILLQKHKEQNNE